MSTGLKRVIMQFTLFCLIAVSFAAPAVRPRLAVFAFGNETGNAMYDSACDGAGRSLMLTLRQLGLYELESRDRPVGRHEEELRAAAMERNADYVMFGGIASGRGKNLVFRLGLFDRAKGKTTLLKESEGVSSLDLFEAIDEVISKVLEGITGARIAFGSVTFVNTGEKGTYRVLLDGMDAGDDLTELPRVLAGAHTLSVMQRRMLGQVEIGRASFTLAEGESREVTFAVPYLTGPEKERLEESERAIRAGLQSPREAAQVEAKITAFSAALRDVSYSPRLAEYQARARQLEAEWTVMKNRFEIEERIWNPDSLLLDPSMVVYLTAKSYPDPLTLRRGAESNASLLATLHELAAGEAMAAERYEDGVKFLESILDFSRYLPSERKAEYAFAVAKMKELVSAREADPDKFKNDLETVFGPQMAAGVKLRSLEGEAKRSGTAVLISSDNSAETVLGTTQPQSGPLLVRSGGELSVRLSRDGEASEMKLTVPEGRRVAFLDGGFSAFGRTKAESSGTGPMAPVNFKCVPRGYTVFANGEKIGVTPLRQAMVPAGYVTLSFERPEEPRKALVVKAERWQEATVTWGTNSDFPITLDRRTMPLVDDVGLWDGIDPILEGKFSHYFGSLSNPRYAINRVFMCRDDKYLYWRIEFAGANPFFAPPVGVGREVVTQLTLRYLPAKELNTTLNRIAGKKEIYSFQGISERAGRKWTQTGDQVVQYINGPTALMQRTSLDRLAKYAKGVIPVYLFLANIVDGKDWGPGSLKTPFRYIDFSR